MRSLHLLLAVLPAALAAQSPPPTLRWVEGWAEHHAVSHGYGDWNGAGVRLTAGRGKDTWYAEARGLGAFKDRGAYVSVADRHEWPSRWTSYVSIGAGTGQFFFPSLRLDGAVGRHWGPAGQVITSLGVTYVNSKSVYADVALVPSVTWYLPGAAVEAGIRFNRSTPGPVHAGRGYGVVTIGTAGRHQLALRLDAGSEAYQLLGAATTITRFNSEVGSAAYRRWLTPAWGGTATVERYHNPSYSRTGVMVGLFRHF